MTLARTLEPEVMDTAEDAADYDAMDHAEVNARFCEDLLAMCSRPGRVLDVGTGTALIPIELCRRSADVEAIAIDLAASMLALARRNVDRASLGERVHLERGDAKALRWENAAFDAVFSNSLVHHVPRPERVLREMHRVVRPGGLLFVRDLVRPERSEEVQGLVERYAPIPASPDPRVVAMHERQRSLFEASLHAALTVEEVIAIVETFGVPRGAVRATSDRHWTLSYMSEGRALGRSGVSQGT